MGKKLAEDQAAQNAGAPQDENADPHTQPKRKRYSAPGKSAMNEKPQPGKENDKGEGLLSDKANIGDETTI